MVTRILRCSSRKLLPNTFDRTLYRWELLITVEANMPHFREGSLTLRLVHPPANDAGSKRCC